MEKSMKSSWCRQPGRRRQGQRGNAIIEASLLAPWMLFLFVGVLDLGFYTHAAIATENAARVAAQYGAAGAGTAGDSAGACTYALQEAL
jgi:Flp pilus assembly protein TadG